MSGEFLDSFFSPRMSLVVSLEMIYRLRVRFLRRANDKVMPFSAVNVSLRKGDVLCELHWTAICSCIGMTLGLVSFPQESRFDSG